MQKCIKFITYHNYAQYYILKIIFIIRLSLEIEWIRSKYKIEEDLFGL